MSITLKQLEVSNFRLLCDVSMKFEAKTTVIVGRNNSGKTSLSEVIRRFLVDSNPSFQLEDFSTSSYTHFCGALKAKNEKKEESEIRLLLPKIRLAMTFEYEPTLPALGPLSEFIVDLDTECTEVLAVAQYELDEGKLSELLDGFPTEDLTSETRPGYFAELRKRIPKLYSVKVWAQDPNDESNRKLVPVTALRDVLQAGFVNAQRGLDDTTTKDSDVLARVLEAMFSTASSPTAGDKDKALAVDLEEAVRDIQTQLDTEFNGKLKNLLPTLETFGYPGLSGPEITTETTLDIKRLLSNYTKVRYVGQDGVLFPETYNGLGVRNLIFILLQIVGFYREFKAGTLAPSVVLIFIEEPEAHLHPQMQEVFITQLSKLADQLTGADGENLPWPVQFVVSTHSSHVANAARFDAIRYFLTSSSGGDAALRQTKVKDLSDGVQGLGTEEKDFLHQYLTLTRCDLFFADKAVVVEGTAERILLPVIIQKVEEGDKNLPRLSSQYITTLEVGGAYAHIFLPLLKFLELKSLIITDLDSVGPLNEDGKRKKCSVHSGETTSNSCIKHWFDDNGISLKELQNKTESERTKGLNRIEYQVPETPDGPCGRTFEEAFMLANLEAFELTSKKPNEMEEEVLGEVDKLKKAEFALNHAIRKTEWVPPIYMSRGLIWLAKDDVQDQQEVEGNQP